MASKTVIRFIDDRYKINKRFKQPWKFFKHVLQLGRLGEQAGSTTKRNLLTLVVHETPRVIRWVTIPAAFCVMTFSQKTTKNLTRHFLQRLFSALLPVSIWSKFLFMNSVWFGPSLILTIYERQLQNSCLAGFFLETLMKEFPVLTVLNPK